SGSSSTQFSTLKPCHQVKFSMHQRTNMIPFGLGFSLQPLAVSLSPMNPPMSDRSRARFGREATPVFIGLLALMAPLSTWSAAQPGFPLVYNTRHEVPALTPADAVKSFRLPPGFHVSLVAGEPDVQQPIGMTMDHRGRLWVAENYTYSERPLG